MRYIFSQCEDNPHSIFLIFICHLSAKAIYSYSNLSSDCNIFFFEIGGQKINNTAYFPVVKELKMNMLWYILALINVLLLFLLLLSLFVHIALFLYIRLFLCWLFFSKTLIFLPYSCIRYYMMMSCFLLALRCWDYFHCNFTEQN